MDTYVYFALRKSIKRSRFEVFYNVAYFIAVTLGYIGLYLMYTDFTLKPLVADFTNNLFIGFFFSFFPPKSRI